MEKFSGLRRDNKAAAIQAKTQNASSRSLQLANIYAWTKLSNRIWEIENIVKQRNKNACSAEFHK